MYGSARVSKKPTIALYSLDVGDVAVVAYYNDEGTNYAKVEVQVNSMIPLGTSHFLLTEDRMLVSLQRAVVRRCFLKEHLRGVMRGKFSPSHSRVIAYCNMVQAIKLIKVIADADGLYWGTPKVIRLNQHCMGTPLKAIYPYATQHNITTNDGVKHRQYNTLAHCRVQLAEQR